MSESIPLAEIIRRAGGTKALARAVGTDRTTPYSWRKVPAQHARTVARLIGAEPWQIRPDVFEVPTNRSEAA